MGEKDEKIRAIDKNQQKIVRLSEPRIYPLKESEWDDDARKLIEGFKKISKGPVSNIMATLANYSKLYNNPFQKISAMIFIGNLQIRC